MKDQLIESGFRVPWHIAQKAYSVAKVTILVSTAVLAIIGAYLVSQPAMMLGHHGIEITCARYLCEIWDSAYETILCYDMVDREISSEQIEEVRSWALDRLSLLWVALQEAVEERGAYRATITPKSLR